MQRLASLPKDQTDANGYSLIPVHAWTHPLADVAACVASLGGARLFLRKLCFLLGLTLFCLGLVGRQSFCRRPAALTW